MISFYHLHFTERTMYIWIWVGRIEKKTDDVALSYHHSKIELTLKEGDLCGEAGCDLPSLSCLLLHGLKLFRNLLLDLFLLMIVLIIFGSLPPQKRFVLGPPIRPGLEPMQCDTLISITML